MKPLSLHSGDRVAFLYRNHRGEEEMRLIIFQTIQWISNEFYPEPTWVITGYDLHRRAPRSFDLSKIDGSTVTVN